MKLISTLSRLFRRDAAAGAGQTRADCGSGAVYADGEFSSAVTALGAKLASTNGPQTPEEFEAFAAVFQPQPADEADVRRLYKLARQTTLGFESYARRLARRYNQCPIVLERVLDGLFQLALADGVVTEEETAYLEKTARALGVSAQVYRAVKARRLGLSEDDPYTVLAVDPAAPDDVVRAAWRQLMVETHPDKVLGRGLSRDLVEKAQIRAQAVNAAFDRVMRERRMGFAVEAA